MLQSFTWGLNYINFVSELNVTVDLKEKYRVSHKKGY